MISSPAFKPTAVLSQENNSADDYRLDTRFYHFVQSFEIEQPVYVMLNSIWNIQNISYIGKLWQSICCRSISQLLCSRQTDIFSSYLFCKCNGNGSKIAKRLAIKCWNAGRSRVIIGDITKQLMFKWHLPKCIPLVGARCLQKWSCDFNDSAPGKTHIYFGRYAGKICDERWLIYSENCDKKTILHTEVASNLEYIMESMKCFKLKFNYLYCIHLFMKLSTL